MYIISGTGQFFFSKILVKNCVVERVEYTPYFQALINAKKVILSSVVLRTLNEIRTFFSENPNAEF